MKAISVIILILLSLNFLGFSSYIATILSNNSDSDAKTGCWNLWKYSIVSIVFTILQMLVCIILLISIPLNSDGEDVASSDGDDVVSSDGEDGSFITLIVALLVCSVFSFVGIIWGAIIKENIDQNCIDWYNDKYPDLWLLTKNIFNYSVSIPCVSILMAFIARYCY